MNKNYFSRLIFGSLFLLSVPGISSGQQVIVGTGTAISVFSPINRTNEYSVYEIIYLASDIGMAGSISKLAFERFDGTNVDLIDSVTLYMKHTGLTELMDTTYSNDAYTLVYSGQFPNDAGAGWREVTLDVPFTYDGAGNLQVLCVKGYQAPVPNPPVTPRWLYTNITPSPARARRYYGPDPVTGTTPLTITVYSSNVRLDFTSSGIAEVGNGMGIVYPSPASGYIRVNSSVKEGMLSVYDPTGKLISFQPFREQAVLSVDRLPSGVYFLKITDGNTGVVYTHRWIKE